MEFLPTSFDGPVLVRSEAFTDERGYFVRARCADEFSKNGLPSNFVQSSISFNQSAGTFRGLHFQVPPSNESKLVRCVAGEIEDIIVDLRPGSATFLQHEWFNLGADKHIALYIPAGFAHGFITKADASMIYYEMTDFYAPELGRGMRWNDPALDIEIPGRIHVMSERDMAHSDVDISDLECFRR